MRKRFFWLALILAFIPVHSFAQVEKEASGYYGIVDGDADDKGPSLKVNTNRSIDVTIVGGGGGDGKILDGTAAGQADVIGSATSGTEQGLVVRCASGCSGAGGTSQADESAFTEGTTPFTPVGGVLNETITSDPTEDQAAAARITPKRGVHTNLRNNAGTEIGTATTPVRTDPTGTTAQPVSGTVTANAGTGTFIVGDGTGPLTVDGTVTVNAGTGTFIVDSELPAAAALADNEANPTVPRVGAMLMCFDGSTWDRCVSTVATASEAQVSCTTTSGTLRAANAARLKFDFLNMSATTVHVCKAATCTTTAGRRYKEDMGYEDAVYTGVYSCITASGTATVHVSEE